MPDNGHPRISSDDPTFLNISTHDHSWAGDMDEVRVGCPAYNPLLAADSDRCPGDPGGQTQAAASGLTRERRDGDGEVRFIVSGGREAVEYHGLTLEGQPLGIEHHSPHPKDDTDEPHNCDILDGPCYRDGTSLGAAKLHDEYVAAGRDTEVIWRGLEECHAQWARP